MASFLSAALFVCMFLYAPIFVHFSAGKAFAAEYETYTYKLSQSTGSYVFWTTTPTERVFKDAAVPTEIGSGIKVYAAKAEFEPFQLVVKPSSSGNVTVNIGDFGSGIQSEIYQVKYVNVISATDSLGRSGPYPDPLWPLEKGATVPLTAEENTSFWFSVSVPATTPAGNYTANVTIGVVSIPVTLHVFNFQVPAEVHVESKMNYSDNKILTKYGVTGTGADYWLYVDKIKQYFIDHRLTPRNPLWSGGLTTDYAAPYIDYDCNGTLTDNDGIWGFDKPAERYLSGFGQMNGTFSQPFNSGVGFPSFQVATFHNNDSSADQRPPSFCGLTRSAADWYVGNNPGSAYNLKWWQYITTVRNYLQTRGYLSLAYYYFANEPQDQADYDAVAWYTRWLKNAAPDLKLMVSENPRPEIYGNSNYVADRQVDIWVPVLNEYDPAVSHDREKNHGEVSWIYFLYGTRPPYFNPITLDHPGIEGKLTGWFLWKYRVKGIAYYQLNDWSLNPWTADPMAGTAQNGDTFMLYPPSPTGDGSITFGANNHRMVPSIRFELMRDSLEDYEYLYLLNSNAQPQVDVPNTSDSQSDKIVTSTTSYTRDGEFMYNLRRLIGEKLGGERETVPDIHPPPGHPRGQGAPGNYYVNFQDPTGSPATTFTEIDPVTGAEYRYYNYNSRNYFQIGAADYDKAAGYGWYAPPEVHWMTTWLGSGPNPLQRSILYSDWGRRATFEFDLPNGVYNLTASVGWQGRTYSHNFIEIEGINFVNDEATTPTVSYIARTKKVTVSDGKLTMVMGVTANDEYTMLNFLDIEAVVPQPATGVTLLSNKLSPEPLNTAGGVTFTASGEGGSGSYEYEFWLYDGLDWTMVRDFSTTETWLWDTKSYAAANYTVKVKVRSLGSLSETGEAETMMSYRLSPLPGDFDGDGSSDILWQNTATEKLAIWYMNGSTMTSAVFLNPSKAGESNWRFVDLGDFNSDGKTDLLWQSNLSGDLVVWYMDGVNLSGSSYLTPMNAGTGNTNWKVVATGDFKGPTGNDILWQNSLTEELAVWYMNGTSMTNAVMLNPSKPGAADWKIVGLGDFNTDGNTDILWQQSTSGDLAVWHMNDVNMTGAVMLNPMNAGTGSADWKAVAVGDYNLDGNPDVLWQNSVSGESVVWYMDGINLISSTALNPASAGTTDWKIRK